MFSGNPRRRLPALVGLVGLLGASLSGCGGGSGTSGGGNNGGGTVNPGPVDFTTRAACQANAGRGGKRWTVLVYINAANNLQPDSLTNVAQMAQTGSDTNVNIAIQWKQANCADCGTPSFTGTRRYFISQKSAADVNKIRQGDTTVLDANRLADPTTNAGGTSDMGDWRVLRDFVRWGAQNYPADHLAVVIWNHGSGWRPTTRAAATRAVSQDNQSGNEIQTTEIPQALSGTAQPLDMLIFDASLMQMLEVAYEVRNSARVLVGSEESPPGAGYPYDTWINQLKQSGQNPCDVGSNIVSAFVANYPNNSNVTQSMIDLSHMDDVATKLSAFAIALQQRVGLEATLIANSRASVQSYAYPDNKDLYHFADLIRTGAGDVFLKQAAAALQDSLYSTNGAILVSNKGRLGQANSNGLAIYIPAPGSYLQTYNELALTRATAWDDFLQSQTR